jgi:N-acetylneuraminic acid mutarotase
VGFSLVNTFGTSGTGLGQQSQIKSVAVDTTRLYVTDRYFQRVHIYDKASGTYLDSFSTTSVGTNGNTNGLYIDSTHIYVVLRYGDENSKSIKKFNKTSPYALVSSVTRSVGCGAGNITSASDITGDDTNIYVTDTSSCTQVLVYDKATLTQQRRIGGNGTGDGLFSAVGGITVDQDYLYVADIGAGINHAIHVFNKVTGAFVLKHLLPNILSSGIAISRGIVFVCLQGSNYLNAYTQSLTNYLLELSYYSIDMVKGVVVDDNDRLYSWGFNTYHISVLDYILPSVSTGIVDNLTSLGCTFHGSVNLWNAPDVVPGFCISNDMTWGNGVVIATNESVPATGLTDISANFYPEEYPLSPTPGVQLYMAACVYSLLGGSPVVGTWVPFELPLPVPPISPTSLSAEGGDRCVTLSWDTDPSTYNNLYWSLTSPVVINPEVGTPATKIEDIESPYVHGGLDPNIEYFYAVTAVDRTSGLESDLSEEVSALTNIEIVAANGRSGGWTQKANLPIRLQDCIGFSIGTDGYVGTGQSVYGDNTTIVKSMYKYDSINDSWSQIADYPIALYNAMAFAIGDTGYVGCGYNFTGDQDVNYSDFYSYDPTSNTWTQRASLPGLARDGGIAFSIGSKGYMGSGEAAEDDWYMQLDFYEYDPSDDTWTQKADVPVGAWAPACFSIGNNGYYAGYMTGYMTDEWVYSTSVYRYNQATNTWSQMSDFIGAARGYAIGFSAGLNGYIGLGGDENGFCLDFYEYSPDNDSWLQIVNGPDNGSFIPASFTIGTNGYIAGGCHNSDVSDECWCFSNPSPKSDGSIDPMIASLQLHESQVFFITPNPGFDIYDVLVDDISVGAVPTYEFTDVIDNHTITALFISSTPPPVVRLDAYLRPYNDFKPSGRNDNIGQLDLWKNKRKNPWNFG